MEYLTYSPLIGLHQPHSSLQLKIYVSTQWLPLTAHIHFTQHGIFHACTAITLSYRYEKIVYLFIAWLHFEKNVYIHRTVTISLLFTAIIGYSLIMYPQSFLFIWKNDKKNNYKVTANCNSFLVCYSFVLTWIKEEHACFFFVFFFFFRPDTAKDSLANFALSLALSINR